MFHTRCPECGSVLKAAQHQRGTLGRCPVCKAKFVIEKTEWWRAATKGAKEVEVQHEGVGGSKGRRPPDVHLHQMTGPYGRVELPPELEAPHRWLLTVAICAVVLLLCAAVLIAWWTMAPHGARELGRLEESPPAGLRPEKASPDKPILQKSVETKAPTPPPAPPVAKVPIEPVPAYAVELVSQIRLASYAPVAGKELPNGTGYSCSLSAASPISFTAYPPRCRVVCEGCLVRPAGAAPDQVVSGGAADRDSATVAQILGAFLAQEEREQFVRWVQDAMRDASLAAESGKAFARERRFGRKVVRCEMATSRVPGVGISVEVANDYKPMAEIDGKPAAANWRDMRAGLTLAEVQAVAGEGKLKSRIDWADRPRETYIWPNGGTVVLENGRVMSWTAP